MIIAHGSLLRNNPRILGGVLAIFRGFCKMNCPLRTTANPEFATGDAPFKGESRLKAIYQRIQELQPKLRRMNNLALNLRSVVTEI